MRRIISKCWDALISTIVESGVEVRRVYRLHREEGTVIPFLWALVKMIGIISVFSFVSVSLWFMIVSWRTPHLEIHKNVYFTYSELDAVSHVLFKDESSERLTVGYPYDVSLECEVPESPNNLQMGPVNVVLRLFGSDHAVPHHEPPALDGVETPLFESTRHLRLIYRGEIVSILQRICLWPLYVIEWVKEKQHIIQPMMEMIVIRVAEERIASAKVALLPSSTQSRPMEVYGCQLHLKAHLGWIDYWIVHHPWVVGYLFVMASFGLMSVVYVEWNLYVHGKETLKWALLLFRRIRRRYRGRRSGGRRDVRRSAERRHPAGPEEDSSGSPSEHVEGHDREGREGDGGHLSRPEIHQVHDGGALDGLNEDIGVGIGVGIRDDIVRDGEMDESENVLERDEALLETDEGSVEDDGMDEASLTEEEQEDGHDGEDDIGEMDDGVRRRRHLTDKE